MENAPQHESCEPEGELPMKNVTEPLDTDVLCGRGGAALRHPGNKTYRTLVQLNKGLYITCIKSEKLKISKSIVAAIREQKGRFLEKNKDGTWDDIGDKKSIEKTSQALREGQPKLKQKIAELGGSAAAAMAHNQGYHHSDGNLAAAAAVAFASNEYSQYEPQVPSPAAGVLDPQTATAFRNHQFLSNSMPTPSTTTEAFHSSISSAEQMPPPDQTFQNLSIRSFAAERDTTRAGNNDVNRMRPSILQRGSMIAHELGVDPQSTRSLMSDFSNYGMAESILSMDVGSRRSLIGLDLTMSRSNLLAAAAAADELDMQSLEKEESSAGMNTVTDRRRFFAKMKMCRKPASGRMSISGRNIDSARSLGDGMPDIHLVESNMSLYSNVSSIGEPGAESRRSIMTGMSRMDDVVEDADGNSIFSDLSKKIGDVSTRSMAMSELSIMEDIDSIDIPDQQQKQAAPMTSTSMEFE